MSCVRCKSFSPGLDRLRQFRLLAVEIVIFARQLPFGRRRIVQKIHVAVEIEVRPARIVRRDRRQGGGIGDRFGDVFIHGLISGF